MNHKAVLLAPSLLLPPRLSFSFPSHWPPFLLPSISTFPFFFDRSLKCVWYVLTRENCPIALCSWGEPRKSASSHSFVQHGHAWGFILGTTSVLSSFHFLLPCVFYSMRTFPHYRKALSNEPSAHSLSLTLKVLFSMSLLQPSGWESGVDQPWG